MSVLISGSIAYDHIMVFQDKFKNHILPDQVHLINVSFLVPEMRKDFGGCAGNIAYANKLLGGNPIPMGTVGKDSQSYIEHLHSLNIDCTAIKVFEEEFTAQAFITNDLDDNQITAFHPGAMSLSHQNDKPNLELVKIGIVSPDGKQGMLNNAQMLYDEKIPFLFDPGQAIPLFSGEELVEMLNQANYFIANDYETKLLENKTGLSVAKMAEKLEAFIVTKGANGIDIYQHQQTTLEIPSASIEKALDPTGCGDAFRGGLLFGLENSFDIKTSVQIGAILGAEKIQVYGPQNYNIDLDNFKIKYQNNYQETIFI